MCVREREKKKPKMKGKVIHPPRARCRGASVSIINHSKKLAVSLTTQNKTVYIFLYYVLFQVLKWWYICMNLLLNGVVTTIL